MKRYLPVLFSFLLLSCTPSTGSEADESSTTENAIDSSYCNCADLTFDQPYNHFWRFEKRLGYTGKCEEFYPDSTLKISKNFVDGKLHGKVVSYYPDGKIHDEKEFDMNLQIGEQITYSIAGEVKFHALYKRGTQTEVLVNRPSLPEEDPWGSN